MSVNHTHAPGSLRKATTAARLAGLTPAMFVASCRSGDIPCQILRLGKRQCAYVKTAELDAWLAPTRNLFA